MASPLDALSRAAALGNAGARRAAHAAERRALSLVDVAVDSRFAEELVEHVLNSGLTDRVIHSPASERLVARLIESPLLDQAVARLLESEDLWVLVDEVARSPAVTDAIGRQSLGFADQVAGAVRNRSLNADDRLEGAVRRLIRRRGEPAGDDG